MRRSIVLLMMLLLLGISDRSYASTECTGHVQAFFTETGSGGRVWVVMPNLLQWYVLVSDPDSHNIVAQVTTSMVANLSVTVRFQADGAACDNSASVRSDVVGVWLSGS